MAERRPIRRAGAAAVAAIVALVLFGAVRAEAARPAQGGDATAERAATLATEAATDDGALADLRALDTVDGRPVDLAAATLGIEGAPDRAVRLRALADELRSGAPAGSGSGSGSTAADRARADARDVLDGPAYRHRSTPRPFRGALRWLGDRLAPVGRLLARIFGPPWRAIASLPGGDALAALVAGGLVALTVVLLVQRRGHVRVRTAGGAGGGLVDPSADPAALEAEADAAEAAGDLGLAVRRRYEAGLVRLVRAGRLDLRPDTTATRVADVIGDEPIRSLTRTFEEVVYGGRPAVAEDVAAARSGWAHLLGARAAR